MAIRSIYLSFLAGIISFQNSLLYAEDAVITPVPSPAVERNVSKQIAALPPIDFTSSLISMVKGLAICIAILLLAIWVLKKLKSPIVTGQGRALKILERLPVSTKSSLLLVEVNKRKLLIGVGSDPVSLVSDFVDTEVFADLSEVAKAGDKNE